MPGLVPGIDVFGFAFRGTWMAGTKPGDGVPGRALPDRVKSI
jgi:hypothetical protein